MCRFRDRQKAKRMNKTLQEIQSQKERNDDDDSDSPSSILQRQDSFSCLFFWLLLLLLLVLLFLLLLAFFQMSFSKASSYCSCLFLFVEGDTRETRRETEIKSDEEKNKKRKRKTVDRERRTRMDRENKALLMSLSPEQPTITVQPVGISVETPRGRQPWRNNQKLKGKNTGHGDDLSFPFGNQLVFTCIVSIQLCPNPIHIHTVSKIVKQNRKLIKQRT